MAKIKMTAVVTGQEQLTEDIFDMRIQAARIAEDAVPGQFVSLYTKDGARLLPRPISLCGIDREAGELRMVYRIAGAGTKEFSKLKAGDTIDVLGPLGNGFPVEPGKKAFLIGGGQRTVGWKRFGTGWRAAGRGLPGTGRRTGRAGPVHPGIPGQPDVPEA